jgi:uncharacterized LabA/DUF88 family protein
MIERKGKQQDEGNTTMPFSTAARPSMAGVTPAYAVVFIDFENIFYFLKDNYADLPDLNDYIFDILRSLQRHLERRLGLRTIISKAYADFERMKSAPQGSLYLMGVETYNVLGTDHKNSSDMKLCIDAMEVLYTRPEIGTFVFLAGDRDYIPLIQHLKKQARSVMAVAFRGNISGDLLMNVGSDNFIDALTLLDPLMLKRLEEMARRQRQIEEAYRERDRQRTAEMEEREGKQDILEELRRLESIGSGSPGIVAEETATTVQPVRTNGVSGIKTNPEEPHFNPVTPIVGENERICLEVLLHNYGHHSEVWMSPFLRKLSDALPRLADFERKALLNTLESSGAIRIEKRRGEPYDYSILLINYNHVTVREVNPG